MHYQLKFGMFQAGYSCINYHYHGGGINLTVTENRLVVVDVPSKERCLGFCQGNKKLSNLLGVNIQSE